MKDSERDDVDGAVRMEPGGVVTYIVYVRVCMYTDSLLLSISSKIIGQGRAIIPAFRHCCWVQAHASSSMEQKTRSISPLPRQKSWRQYQEG